jgi:hypothetical protein
MTATGAVVVGRAYFVCSRCRNADCPLDERLGLGGYLSPEARRLCCLAGGSWSFDQAAAHLRCLCGMAVSDELIRRVCLKGGAALAAWQATAPAAVADFRAAAGDAEFETDAVKVNTTEGWRDVKLAIFARRPRGAAAAAAHWADRRLPKPTARYAFAGIADSVTFAAAWRPMARRLGIDPDADDLTVLGDGADWIWNRAAEQFPHAPGVLDVFHGAGRICDTSKALFGEGTDLSRDLSARGTRLLVSDGYAGLVDWAGEIAGQPRAGTDGAALGAMLNYFAGHRQRLNYALRLRRGQSIGSGMVEGAAKNMIGRRLKANNARWCAANVNRIAGLCTALYSGIWEAYWQNH